MKPRCRALLCLAAFLLLFSACAADTGTAPLMQTPSPPVTAAPTAAVTESPAPATAAPTVEPTPSPTPAPVPVRLTAVGDNLLHSPISKNAKKADGSYDFSHLYEDIMPYLEGSDLAYINQETMLAGGVSGYPRFSSPPEVADALYGAGFNIINVANNHCLDQGINGLTRCLEALRARPFDAVIGAYLEEEERDKPILVEKQGIVFGFLSYTYGFNGLTAPKGKAYMLSQINKETLAADVENIRPLCDYLIVSMHWGYEYHHEPNEEQRELAQLLCDGGVDLVLGTHPHVIQPMEWLVSENGHEMLCVFSLGNFVSTQEKKATMLGGLFEMELQFDPQSKRATVDFAGIVPLVTYYEAAKKGNRIYPLALYTEELAAAHGIRNYAGQLSPDYLWGLAEQVLGENIR